MPPKRRENLRISQKVNLATQNTNLLAIYRFRRRRLAWLIKKLVCVLYRLSKDSGWAGGVQLNELKERTTQIQGMYPRSVK